MPAKKTNLKALQGSIFWFWYLEKWAHSLFGELAGKARHFHLVTAVINPFRASVLHGWHTRTLIRLTDHPVSNKKIKIGLVYYCMLSVQRNRWQKKNSSTRIAKMGDCNDSSSHGDSSLSSESDGEYQIESGKTREPQTRKTSKQLRYYYRKTAGKTKRTYTPFADQENPSQQLKCYHAMKECESATVSAEHDLSLESDDTSDNTRECVRRKR